MSRKRVPIILLLMLCLIHCLPIEAEEKQSVALFSTYDEATEKWRYIDVTGQWAIAPQFDYARNFRGDYAAVNVRPEGFPSAETERTGFYNDEGIIDRTGRFVPAPAYSLDAGYGEINPYYGGKDTGIWW